MINAFLKRSYDYKNINDSDNPIACISGKELLIAI